MEGFDFWIVHRYVHLLDLSDEWTGVATDPSK